MPKISPDKGIELLERQCKAAQELLDEGAIEDADWSAWETATRNYLERIFGPESPNIRDVLDVGKYGSFPMNASSAWWVRHRAESLSKQKKILEGLIEYLHTEIEIEEPGPNETEIAETIGDHVFLVHGHDEAALHGTARFLESLELSVRVLREEPDQGRTIIEKFVEYSDVGFAIVLLTPDDLGGESDSDLDGMRPRARQNVIFELGFFIGKLGRKRVCALHTGGVEIPSDYSGVLFIPMDESGGWRLKLARELRAAGFAVDMNKAV